MQPKGRTQTLKNESITSTRGRSMVNLFAAIKYRPAKKLYPSSIL